MTTTNSDRSVGRRALAVLLSVMTTAALLAGLAQAGPAQADISFDRMMLDLVNQQRVAAGITPLQWSDSLGAAAENAPYNGCGFTVHGRAFDMGERNYFSHSILGCAPQGVFNLLGGLGIVSSSSGENIAWMNGTTDYSVAAQRLTTDLMNSPAHRANILNPDFTQLGIGSWRTSPGQTWSGGGTPLSNVWITTQIFGRMAVTAAPAVAVTPTGLAFGDRTVGTISAPQAVTVTNRGSGALSVRGASIVGSDAAGYAVSSNGCGTVPAGASCTVNVTFTPRFAGPSSASLQIVDDAAGSPHSVSLTGNGAAATVVPAAPLNVRAAATSGQMSVSWSAAGWGAAVDGYALILWDTAGPTGQQLQVCATCFTSGFSGLTSGKAYYVTVYAHGAAGWSSPAQSGWTTAATRPSAPRGALSDSGDGQILTTWTAPPLDAAIDSYGVYVFDSTGYTGRSASVCATCAAASVAGLTNGHQYYAMIYAHNASGWGLPATTEAVTVGTPGRPIAVSAKAGNGSVTAAWSAPTSVGSPVDSYAVYLFESNVVVGYSVVCGSCASAMFTGLANGHSGYVSVFAHNANGWGLRSSSTTVTPAAS